MTSTAGAHASHDLAIVRALRAMLEDAICRSDHVLARDLAAQIEDEIRRRSARCARR